MYEIRIALDESRQSKPPSRHGQMWQLTRNGRQARSLEGMSGAPLCVTSHGVPQDPGLPRYKIRAKFVGSTRLSASMLCPDNAGGWNTQGNALHQGISYITEGDSNSKIYESFANNNLPFTTSPSHHPSGFLAARLSISTGFSVASIKRVA